MLVGLIFGGLYTAAGSAFPLPRALSCCSEAVVVAVGASSASGLGAYCMGSSSAESSLPPALSLPCACDARVLPEGPACMNEPVHACADGRKGSRRHELAQGQKAVRGLEHQLALLLYCGINFSAELIWWNADWLLGQAEGTLAGLGMIKICMGS